MWCQLNHHKVKLSGVIDTAESDCMVLMTPGVKKCCLQFKEVSLTKKWGEIM